MIKTSEITLCDLQSYLKGDEKNCSRNFTKKELNFLNNSMNNNTKESTKKEIRELLKNNNKLNFFCDNLQTFDCLLISDDKSKLTFVTLKENSVIFRRNFDSDSSLFYSDSNRNVYTNKKLESQLFTQGLKFVKKDINYYSVIIKSKVKLLDMTNFMNIKMLYRLMDKKYIDKLNKLFYDVYFMKNISDPYLERSNSIYTRHIFIYTDVLSEICKVCNCDGLIFFNSYNDGDQILHSKKELLKSPTEGMIFLKLSKFKQKHNSLILKTDKNNKDEEQGKICISSTISDCINFGNISDIKFSYMRENSLIYRGVGVLASTAEIDKFVFFSNKLTAMKYKKKSLKNRVFGDKNFLTFMTTRKLKLFELSYVNIKILKNYINDDQNGKQEYQKLINIFFKENDKGDGDYSLVVSLLNKETDKELEDIKSYVHKEIIKIICSLFDCDGIIQYNDLTNKLSVKEARTMFEKIISKILFSKDTNFYVPSGYEVILCRPCDSVVMVNAE